jgi:hypothetical protein
MQKSMSDQAANCIKLLLGLGYPGFFAAWSGMKVNLRPVELVGSALLSKFQFCGECRGGTSSAAALTQPAPGARDELRHLLPPSIWGWA